MNNFKDIRTRNELADFLSIPRKKLTHILYVAHTENLYTSFAIPKKNGGTRNINAPTHDLKAIQKKLAIALWEYQKSIWEAKNIHPNLSHAFEKNKSIITNAKIHRNKRFILNIDLEDFFDSFHFGRVRGFFEKNMYFNFPIEVATVIAQISCYKGCLPQGAPSSPIITNLMCQILDIRILKLAKKFRLDYTRYADDLTFSTNNKSFLETYQAFFQELLKEIKCVGFKINDKKTRLLYKDSRQEVTGLIVNKKINVDRRYYKATRAMATSLYSTGVFKINKNNSNIEQLEGRLSFINQLQRYNNEIDGKAHNFRTLCSREKQYQQFLFYKYFLANDKPLIVTEGKTDIAYIKSALKKLSLDYPDLISKTDNVFKFKVSFLNRTKKLQYFLNLGQNGADTIKNIYNFYVGQEACRNYLKYFEETFNTQIRKPVILIFDNEIFAKNKPLNKFAQIVGLSEGDKAELSNHLYRKLLANLYLLTNPLQENAQESEIEDLFDCKTLSHEINEKKFSRSSDFDNSKFYGKEIFSKYISNNYNAIDFSKFKPLLDGLNEIIKSYEKI